MAKILDYGCGPGQVLSDLRQVGFTNLHGIDFSSEMLRRAKETVPDALYELKRRNRLPYQDASFDCVLLMNVLGYIIPNLEQMRLVDEIRRVLRPQGVVFVTDYLLADENEDVIGAYNEFKGVYKNETFDYDYGVFEMPGTGVLCRHHDQEWVRNLFSEFKLEEFDIVTARDHVGLESKGFCMVCSIPKIEPLV
eukprot:NODE_3199_length_803_cov_84.340849_g2670_i0.p2 GENE.NODE_3199_length_803_cov_84.340849_g2670_i0~~NODE_3199_length_803_cov_84.340849_g2670_i0.p2  ORF type:complete len:218 (-),score=54.89 NODE_3199_length_803_cov_84.340849_g2670_i0:149-730(-)